MIAFCPIETADGFHLTRRDLLKTAVAVSVATAMPPVFGDEIATDASSVESGDVKIPTKNGDIPAYRAMPATGERFPVVLVVHNVLGVNEHIRETCRRLARSGYLAVAPDVFARQADVSKMVARDVVRKVIIKVPDGQVISDLDATLSWAQGEGNKGSDKVDVCGFSWGGRVALVYAAYSDKLKACVVWNGFLFFKADFLHPQQPLDVVEAIKVPVLGFYGGRDPSNSSDLVDALRVGVKNAGQSVEIVVYPDARNDFFTDEIKSFYRKDDADDGWKRMLEWFKKHGMT